MLFVRIKFISCLLCKVIAVVICIAYYLVRRYFLQLTEADQELYKNFPLVVSDRWQAEIAGNRMILIHLLNNVGVQYWFKMPQLTIWFDCYLFTLETVFSIVNADADKVESKRTNKQWEQGF